MQLTLPIMKWTWKGKKYYWMRKWKHYPSQKHWFDKTEIKSWNFIHKRNEYCRPHVISQAGKSENIARYILTAKLQIIRLVHKDGSILRTYLTQQLSQIRFNSQSNSESIYSVAEVFEAQNISNENSK